MTEPVPEKIAPTPVETVLSSTSTWEEKFSFLLRTGAISDGRYDHFLTSKVEDHPRGYPRLAAFLDSDIDGRLYRRFGYLRNYLLLHGQDEISVLEEEINALDKDHQNDDPYRLCSRRYDEENSPKSQRQRKQLLSRLNETLKEYDDLLLREHAIMSIKQPSDRMHRSYFDYVWNEKPLCPAEYRFIFHRDDFVALGEQGDTWLRPFVEVFLAMVPRRLLKASQNINLPSLGPEEMLTVEIQLMLSSRREREKSDNPDLEFYSNQRANTLVKAIVASANTLLLIVPIVVLYLLTTHGASGGTKIGT